MCLKSCGVKHRCRHTHGAWCVPAHKAVCTRHTHIRVPLPLRFVPGSGPGDRSAAVSSGSVTACK
eukprot:1160650-Pelagomonas_calceolata.AAC.4